MGGEKEGSDSKKGKVDLKRPKVRRRKESLLRKSLTMAWVQRE